MTAINSDRQLAHAADIIRNGGVIAYPTEGVWGLGCDPTLEAAVNKLLALKHRAVTKGLILIGSDADQFAPFTASLDHSQMSLFKTKRESCLLYTSPSPRD